jgi:N-acyl amino acid synthase of PEP-CTERM/exosortase system
MSGSETISGGFVMAEVFFKQVETEAELREVYRLRYQVYCLERGFEALEDHPEGIEKDKYDPYSVHFIALDADKKVIGTARLVKHNAIGFPAVENCKFRINLDNIPADNIAEISRFAISKVLRRRVTDGVTGLPDPVADAEAARRLNIEDRRLCPQVALGLLKALYRESKWLGIENWICAIEKATHILLRHHSVPFVQVGDEVEYHGRRAPYMVRLSVIERTMALDNPKNFRFMTDWPRKAMFEL